MKKSFHIATFGCKANQYDAQSLREALLAAGYEDKPLAEGPDFVIVNTCTVTSTADAKARRLIHRLAREVPTSRVVVTGCMVSRDRHRIGSMPGVWLVVDNEHKPTLPGTLEEASPLRPASEGPTLWPEPGISGFTGHTRAFVKVQDGCDAGCAYCIVPLVRGKPRSRPMSEAVEEVRRLSAKFREIVLTGIHLGLYRDHSGADLGRLVREILQTADVERLRLSSIEVNEITPELIELAASGRLCPHFHVPLQSGSDRVLGMMNRRYSADEFLKTLDRIGERLDRPSFTTDVIAGFPGETDADFEETLSVCKSAGFSRMHIFPYSDRPGTAAAAMSGKCAVRVIAERKGLLERLASDLALEYKRKFVGETVGVLVETVRDRSGRLSGYTDRYLRVSLDGDDTALGRIVPVRITGAEPETLFGATARAGS